MVYNGSMDGLSAVEKGFQDEFWRILGEDLSLEVQLLDLNEEQSLELGRQGARATLAPLLWSHAIGDRWDVRRVTEFLGTSRQAIYKRLKLGSALGVQGRGTTWFPTWQFDTTERIVRAVTRSIISAFHDADPTVDPLVIAAWAMKANPSLEGMSPAAWLTEGRQEGAVVLAARRAAKGLSA